MQESTRKWGDMDMYTGEQYSTECRQDIRLKATSCGGFEDNAPRLWKIASYAALWMCLQRLTARAQDHKVLK